MSHSQDQQALGTGEEQRLRNDGIVLLGGCAYTLQFGTLLACAVKADGHTLDMLDGEPNWGDCDDFELEPAVQAEINLAFSALLSFETEAGLTAEYEIWCANERLPCISADEFDLANLTRSQQAYIKRFIWRWERVAAGTRGRARPLDHNAWLDGRIDMVEVGA